MRFPELLNSPSRFARWPAWASMLVLILLALLVALGMANPLRAPGPGNRHVAAITGVAGAVDSAGDDVALYRAMAEHVQRGEDYYAATARLLRDNDYPLRPFVTFRLPTLTWFLATVPRIAAIGLMALLLGAVILAWTVRLAPALKTADACSWASLFIMMNGLSVFSPSLIVFHEGWASLLVALSLALHREDRWASSVALAMLAVLIRELALPYVLLMGVFALTRRRWPESIAWLMVVLVFMGALALHAHAVWAVTNAADPPSPGWSGFGGLPFVAIAIQQTTPLEHLPFALTPLLFPLALLGWAAWTGPTASRVFLYLAGFAAAMMIFGRPDNFYWAVMITPLLFVGLLFVPAALQDLLRNIMRRPAVAT